MAEACVDWRPSIGASTPSVAARPSVAQPVLQPVEQGGDPVVVEPGGDGAEHRLSSRRRRGAPVVPAPLPAHLAEGVVGAPAVELVDGHHVGQLQHVDLLELGGGTVLGGHHVEGYVGDLGHGGVALADARGLHDDQVESGGTACRHHQREPGRQLGRRSPGGQGTEVDVGRVDGVHADAVPEQGAAAPASGGVDGQYGDGQLVLLIETEPADQLVGQRRLPRTSGAGDAQHRSDALSERDRSVSALVGIDRCRPRCG